MAHFLENDEQIILHGNGSYIKSMMNVLQGTFYLTNKRVVFARAAKGIRIFAAPIGGLVQGTDVTFVYPYTEFKSLTVAKHGFAKKYILTWLSGDNQAVQLIHHDKWMATFRELLAAHSGGTLVDDGAEAFHIER